MSDLIKVGGLWKNKDKNGNDYFSGNFTYGTKLLVMTNSYKDKDNAPDYMVYIAQKDKKESESVLSEKRLKDVSKQGMRDNGMRTMKKSSKLWLMGILIVYLVSLHACGSKVVLLKDGEMRLMENENYSVSPVWIEERLQFENDMVKRLQECHSTN